MTSGSPPAEVHCAACGSWFDAPPDAGSGRVVRCAACAATVTLDALHRARRSVPRTGQAEFVFRRRRRDSLRALRAMAVLAVVAGFAWAAWVHGPRVARAAQHFLSGAEAQDSEIGR